MARIRVALRHRGQSERPAARTYRASGVEIDLQRHQVIKQGERVRLTPTEFKLLNHFMRHPERVQALITVASSPCFSARAPAVPSICRSSVGAAMLAPNALSVCRSIAA